MLTAGERTQSVLSIPRRTLNRSLSGGSGRGTPPSRDGRAWLDEAITGAKGGDAVYAMPM